MRARLLALALLLLLPTAAAQPLPTQQARCDIDVPAITVPANGFAPGSTSEVTVAVENVGSAAANVRVAASLVAPGFAVSPSEATANAPPGEVASFTFEVQVAQDATGDATLDVTASAQCPPPEPLPCPSGQTQNVCQAAEESNSATLRLQASEGFRVPGLDAVDFPLEYLVAGLVLVGIAAAIPFLVKKRPTGVAAECPEPLKMVRAGRGASFPVEVRNPAAEAAVATFEVGPVPEGWSAFMPLPEVQLAPREARSLFLMVRSPATAAPGDAVEVDLHVRTAGKADKSTRVRVRAEVAPEAGDAAPGA